MIVLDSIVSIVIHRCGSTLAAVDRGPNTQLPIALETSNSKLNCVQMLDASL